MGKQLIKSFSGAYSMNRDFWVKDYRVCLTIQQGHKLKTESKKQKNKFVKRGLKLKAQILDLCENENWIIVFVVDWLAYYKFNINKVSAQAYPDTKRWSGKKLATLLKH